MLGAKVELPQGEKEALSSILGASVQVDANGKPVGSSAYVEESAEIPFEIPTPKPVVQEEIVNWVKQRIKVSLDAARGEEMDVSSGIEDLVMRKLMKGELGDGEPTDVTARAIDDFVKELVVMHPDLAGTEMEVPVGDDEVVDIDLDMPMDEPPMDVEIPVGDGEFDEPPADISIDVLPDDGPGFEPEEPLSQAAKFAARRLLEPPAGLEGIYRKNDLEEEEEKPTQTNPAGSLGKPEEPDETPAVELNEHQQCALKTFADVVGTGWKAALEKCWAASEYVEGVDDVTCNALEQIKTLTDGKTTGLKIDGTPQQGNGPKIPEPPEEEKFSIGEDVLFSRGGIMRSGVIEYIDRTTGLVDVACETRLVSTHVNRLRRPPSDEIVALALSEGVKAAIEAIVIAL